MSSFTMATFEEVAAECNRIASLGFGAEVTGVRVVGLQDGKVDDRITPVDDAAQSDGANLQPLERWYAAWSDASAPVQIRVRKPDSKSTGWVSFAEAETALLSV